MLEIGGILREGFNELFWVSESWNDVNRSIHRIEREEREERLARRGEIVGRHGGSMVFALCGSSIEKSRKFRISISSLSWLFRCWWNEPDF